MSDTSANRPHTSIDIRLIHLLLLASGNSHISLKNGGKLLYGFSLTFNASMIILKTVTAILHSLLKYSPTVGVQLSTVLFMSARAMNVIESIKLMVLSKRGILDDQLWWMKKGYTDLTQGNIISIPKRLFYVCYLLCVSGMFVFHIYDKVVHPPPCYPGNSTWNTHLMICSVQNLLNIFVAMRAAQGCLVIVYIYVHCITFAASFQKLTETMKSETMLCDSQLKVFNYRKQYGYLCQYVSTFNDVIGFNTALSLLYLMLQVVAMSIILKGNHHAGFVFTAVVLSTGFALLMYGAICLAEAAKGPLPFLNDETREKMMSGTDQYQLRCFIKEVESAPKISVLGFMDLDKQQFLTIIGIIATYFFVLLPFINK